jgi:16S rRNA C1402 (ribose-2'-O) methylase RsmI
MLIYLDIDGVMLPANSWRKPEILEDGFVGFSKKATDALNRIISDSDSNIVLTTSHKWIYTIKQWKEIFKRRNVNVKNISRLPENKNYLNRKDELLKWFNSDAIEDNFIIIDDDKSLNALPEVLKNRLVQTNSSVGLTDYLADEALAIIKKIKFEIA